MRRNLARIVAITGLATAALVVVASQIWVDDSPSAPGWPVDHVTVSAAGRVIDIAGRPIAGAEVRFQGRAAHIHSDAAGRFRLIGQPAPRITATKPGYFIGGRAVDQTDSDIVLAALPERDCPDYDWVDPAANPAGEHNCANCHETIYEQWQTGGHAASATNRRLLNLQSGTDWHGAAGGWSLADDYPSGVSVCAACHGPTVPLSDPAQTDLRLASGVAAHGVHCDYCHKVNKIAPGDVGLAHGRFAVELLRPDRGQLFFGPLPDVDRGEDAYSPLLSKSRFCATCHEGVVFGVHVYSTYSEWLASPARAEGKHCQSCHMKPDGQMTNVAPAAGGIERDPATLASHTLLPGGRQSMLRGCLAVTTDAVRDRGRVQVRVTVRAHDVGHRVPTGFIDRHLILHIAGRTTTGVMPELLEGPVLRQVGDVTLTGSPGYLYGRLLTGADGRGPIPFWREHRAPVDTRLAPEQPHTTKYDFARDTVQVRVRLVYRRFWRDPAREKQWPDNEIVIYDKTLEVPGGGGSVEHPAAMPPPEHP